MSKPWNMLALAALVMMLAACSSSSEEGPTNQPSREEELQALVDDALANPMSKEDSDAYNLLVAQETQDNRSQANHFYTTSEEEKAAAEANGYTYEGQAGFIFTSDADSLAPLYRLNNPDKLDHLYTTSEAERDEAEAAGYIYEGIQGYLYPDFGQGPYPPDWKPFYRLYDVALSDHFYTTSTDEFDSIVDEPQWYNEGLAGYLPSEGEGTVPLYRLVKSDPAVICEGTLPEESRDVLFAIVGNAFEQDSVSPETLNSLSESLTDKFGCDYGVNGNLITQWGGSGVVEVDFAAFAGLIEQQTAEMDLSADQLELVDLTAESLRQMGTQLVPYDNVNLNYDFGDTDPAVAVASIEINPINKILTSACGFGFCISPSGALVFNGGPIPVSFVITENALILSVDKGIFTDAIPGFDVNAGFSATFQEGDSFLNLVTPDAANVFLDVGGCVTAYCTFGEPLSA